MVLYINNKQETKELLHCSFIIYFSKQSKAQNFLCNNTQWMYTYFKKVLNV